MGTDAFAAADEAEIWSKAASEQTATYVSVLRTRAILSKALRIRSRIGLTTSFVSPIRNATARAYGSCMVSPCGAELRKSLFPPALSGNPHPNLRAERYRTKQELSSQVRQSLRSSEQEAIADLAHIEMPTRPGSFADDHIKGFKECVNSPSPEHR
jgi:hypothetical protein